MKRFWSEMVKTMDDILHPVILVPNPRYYWRRWRQRG